MFYSEFLDLFNGLDEEQGWNETTMALLLCEFISQKKLSQEFQEFIQNVADGENVECESEEEELEECEDE